MIQTLGGQFESVALLPLPEVRPADTPITSQAYLRSLRGALGGMMIIRQVVTALGISISLLSSAASSGAASFDSWLGFEANKAREGLLANISPAGTARGAVVASPSRAAPDYYYHWIRDAA